MHNASAYSSLSNDVQLSDDQLSLINDFPILSEQTVRELRKQEVTSEWLNKELNIIPSEAKKLKDGIRSWFRSGPNDPLPQVSDLVGAPLDEASRMQFTTERFNLVRNELENQGVPPIAINKLTDFIKAYHYKQISKLFCF